jgi:hypothetical protein
MISKRVKIIIIFFLFLSVNLLPAFFNPAKAQVMPVVRTDIWAEIKDTFQSAAQWMGEKFMWANKWQEDTLAAIIWKNALGRFLNRLAYDSAVFLATGDKGQAPMFQTDNFGDFVTKAADTAAGDFIEMFSRYGPVKFNLCNPDIAGLANVKLKIGLGLAAAVRPREPDCTFSEMKRNWERELKDPDFLFRFQNAFEPHSSDIGIALSIQTIFNTQIEREAQNKANDYIVNKGIKPVTDFISGKIKTPAPLVEKKGEQAIEESTEKEKTFTGNIIADAINVFISTLVGTLMDEWFNKGLVRNFSERSSIANFYGTASGKGIIGAKSQFRKLLEPNFNVKGDYNVLGELTVCPLHDKAGPTECVITESFRQAIEEKMTVGEALTSGYLKSNAIFGFSADGLEPSFQEGYPYRSMIILRKYRIIPVGWELAAQKIKADQNNDEIKGSKTLGDLVACYDSGDEYTGYYAEWCRGLVNPDWVLKAPMNYCRRSGPGTQILSDEVVGDEENSRRVVYRADDYCADEQTCISEGRDGSCRLYGYCTEEKPAWNFNSKQCPPIFNTCSVFKGVGGQSAFLGNTLDYAGCNSGNSGCKEYCLDYNPANNKYTCTFNSGNKIYLDSDAGECRENDEGCHEFIRTAPGLGANLLPNSSFEDDLKGWTAVAAGASTVEADPNEAYHGSKSARIYHAGGNGSTMLSRRVAGLLEEEMVTVSYYVKTQLGIGGGQSGAWVVPYFFDANNNPVYDTSDPNNPVAWARNAEIENSIGGEGIWKRVSFTFITPRNTDNIVLELRVQSVIQTAWFDGIKVERGGKTTDYSDYRANSLIYQKLAPAYLNCGNPASASPLCSNFVHFCSQEEVNCRLYKSAIDGMTVPAVVTINDYCPQECVGYDQYIQSETYFGPSEAAYFIPKTARRCSAQSSGCEEFTNLDRVGNIAEGEKLGEFGAEGREYYISLRQCRKPDGQCSDFYTWEGSNESGYQLRLFSLQRQADTDSNPAPYAISSEYQGMTCTASTYNLEINPMCREFYNNRGEVFYRFYNFTISCSDNCHPYRRTEKSTQADCVKYGGEWKASYNACIYMAIPGEGEVCSASQSGCREYNGKTGANMRVVMHNDFEKGTRENWNNGTISSESLLVGGHSLSSPGSLNKNIGSLLNTDKSYVLKFIAKSGGASSFGRVSIGHSAPEIDFNLGASALTAEWRTYEFDLPRLNNEDGDYHVTNSDMIFIQANGGFFIDEILLIEIRDRYYLIKNSWKTPNACYNDMMGKYVGPAHNLGCAAYSDQNNVAHNLKSFSSLCREEAIGCEAMIDTHNYSPPEAAGWNGGEDGSCAGDGRDCVIVPADSRAYVVYDSRKQCKSASQGCTRAGSPYEYESDIVYRNVFINNNPDNYEQSLCSAAAKGCDAWQSENGEKYFKDPGGHICEWRQKSGEGSFAWYKKKVSKCGGSGGVCLDNADCPAGAECLVDQRDILCRPETEIKTIGLGLSGSGIILPGRESINNIVYSYAGACPVSESGCAEFIDPISAFSSNLIFNSGFEQDVDNNMIADGWTAAANGRQNVDLRPSALYVFAIESKSGSNSLTVSAANNIFRIIMPDNKLGAPQNTVTLSSSNNRASAMVYVVGSANASVTATVANARRRSAPNNSRVEIKPALIDYQLSQNIDSQSCNGRVDRETGCVLFNERAVVGGSSAAISYAELPYDSDNSPNTSGNPAMCAGQTCDSNALISVTPDRDCNEWLACRSYVKNEKGENICFDIGLCNRFDESGRCNNFLVPDNKLLYRYDDLVSDIGSLSGYSKVVHKSDKSNPLVYYYHLGAMSQNGESTYIVNGNFEISGGNGYPIGWYFEGQWDPTIFRILNNPVEIQKEGLGRAPEGAGVIKMGGPRTVRSGVASIIGGKNYYLTFYANTKNLISGNAEIYVNKYDYNGGSTRSQVLSIPATRDWKKEFLAFDAAVGDHSVEIVMRGSNGSLGNFYLDDFQIRPALNSGRSNNRDWYIPQTCRLFPDKGALSCEYVDNTGLIKKGSRGYCLEYDRFPGSEETCLLWYPVDRVKGEGIEEGAGYNGKYPVYYAVDIEREAVTGTLNTPFIGGGYDGLHTTSFSYQNFDVNPEYLSDMWRREFYMENIAVGTYLTLNKENNWKFCLNTCGGNCSSCSYSCSNGVLIEAEALFINGIFQNIVINSCDISTRDRENPVPLGQISATSRIPYASGIVKTVTELGQNKYWSGRVYEGTSYTMPCNQGLLGAPQTCNYHSSQPPFGSLIPPANSPNPYEWDSKTGKGSEGIQPLFFEVDTAIAGMGQMHTPEQLQRIFAQSYGAWRWQKRCEGGTDTRACVSDDDCASGYCVGRYRDASALLQWRPPNSLCGAARPAYPNDYCAIPPVISNILVDKQAANITLYGSQFVNLTFNTRVDQQQLPMVMYDIDWGDNENTTVTGVEMRDRPEAGNPHSLYHLYSYWDLKAKNSQDMRTSDNVPINVIYCGTANSTTARNSQGATITVASAPSKNYCAVRPRIKVKDNWDWCNGGTSRNDCGHWANYGGWVVVVE